MNRTTMVILLVVAVWLVSTCAAEDLRYPTNLELIGQAVRQAADSMGISPPPGSMPVLELRAGEGEEAAWLLDNVLKEHLLDMGWRIRAQSAAAVDSVQRADYVLKMRVAELGLHYRRSWRRFLFGSKVVERMAKVALYYELIDVTDESVVASSDVSGEAVDVVPASMLESLSSPKYSFASPNLDKSQWDRYLEGGLVIAIIGVLVYLFYSNKTAS
jgi:hypothetical protein